MNTNITHVQLSSNIHTLTFNVNKSLRDKLLMTKIDMNNIMFVDEQVKIINDNINNIIMDYNYEIINDTTINFALLFKPVLKSLNVRQKFTKCFIVVDKIANNIVVRFDKNVAINLGISSEVEFLPITHVKITFEDDSANPEQLTITLLFESEYDLTQDKSFNILLTMLKETIEKGISQSLLS